MVGENLNWNAAGLRCQSLHKDAHLLVINDAVEQQAVAGWLSSMDSQCPCYVLFISCLTFSYTDMSVNVDLCSALTSVNPQLLSTLLDHLLYFFDNH